MAVWGADNTQTRTPGQTSSIGTERCISGPWLGVNQKLDAFRINFANAGSNGNSCRIALYHGATQDIALATRVGDEVIGVQANHLNTQWTTFTHPSPPNIPNGGFLFICLSGDGFANNVTVWRTGGGAATGDDTDKAHDQGVDVSGGWPVNNPLTDNVGTNLYYLNIVHSDQGGGGPTPVDPTGLISRDGDDLNAVFEPLSSTAGANVGFLSSDTGTDIATLFEPYASGSKAAVTGFESGGSDLRDIFALKTGFVPFGVTVTPTSTVLSRSNGTESINLTATVDGGVGPFTYQWTKSIAGASSSFIGGTTNATAQVDVTGTDTEGFGSITCVVTDTGNSNEQGSDQSTVSITFGNPPE